MYAIAYSIYMVLLAEMFNFTHNVVAVMKRKMLCKLNKQNKTKENTF